MDSLQSAFLLLLPSLPLVIVQLVGIIVSATKMGRYRKAAALGMAGFSGLLMGQLIRAAGTLMTLPAFRGSMSVPELGFRLAFINIGATTLVLGGTICLLLAIFAGRDRAR